MQFDLCERYGFDTNAISNRLRLTGLADTAVQAQGAALQELVIQPNVAIISERFYAALSSIEDFNRIVSQHTSLQQLRTTQHRYLLSLGVGLRHRQYFEERLRIGAIHHDIGVSQVLYQSSFRLLQELLIQSIPARLRDDPNAFEDMVQFVLKITALDMSLAIESYSAATVAGLRSSLEYERGESERLRHLATTDWLTKLHNHSNSRNILAGAMARAEAHHEPLCVIMADLDHFKDINDTNGHLQGDHVLRIAAARMLSCARADDEIGRYGGEEFLFILQNTDRAKGREIAERVRTRISRDAIREHGLDINLSMSFGVAEARNGDDVDTLIARADTALYAAKFAGRNCVRVDTPVDPIEVIAQDP